MLFRFASPFIYRRGEVGASLHGGLPLIVALILSATALLAVPDAAAQRAGLLLGLAHDGASPHCPYAEDDNRRDYECYRTYWIAPPKAASSNGASADSPAIRQSMDGLVLPRRDGWWHLNVRPYWVENRDAESYQPYRGVNVAAAPVQESLRFPPDSVMTAKARACWEEGPNTGDGLDKTIRVLYAGTDYVSLEMTDEGYCGGARMIHYVGRSTLPIDSLQQPRRSYTGSGLPNPLRTPPVARRADGLVSDAIGRDAWASEVGVYVDRVPGAWWTHTAANGQWHLLGDDTFRLSSAPASVVGPDSLPVPMTAIQRVLPDAADAVAAPNTAFLAILTTTDQLYTIRVADDGELDASTLQRRVAFDAPVRIVGVQWALGRHVDRWTAALSELPGLD